MKPQLLTITQIAELCSCSENHIRGLVNKGELPASYLGGKILINLNDLNNTLKPVHPLTKPTPITTQGQDKP